jgi:hypothetical protein
MFRQPIAQRNYCCTGRMMLIAEALEYANAYGILLEVARRDVRDDAGIRRCNGVSALRRLGLHAQVILGRV